MRVLIIEDEFLIATTLAKFITDAGHVVVGMTASAKNAIQLLNDRKCDAAVLDANLAGSSSDPIGTALRLRGVPFVVVSGYSQRQLLSSLKDAPFLPKPVNPGELLDILEELTRGKAECH